MCVSPVIAGCQSPLRAGARCTRIRGFGNAEQRRLSAGNILEKEVIQPQVPLRLPCYDLVPITELAFGAALLAVGLATSGALSFHDLTGGVYKAQEHIHRGIADPRLLAIPTSCRRVAAYNPNWGWLC